MSEAPLIHILPINDFRPHDETVVCWCLPDLDEDLVIHHSMDGRETYENGRKPQ